MSMKKWHRFKSGLLAMVFGVSVVMAMPVSAQAAVPVNSTKGVVGIYCGKTLCNLYTTNCTASNEYCVSNGDENHTRKVDETFTCSRGHETVVTSILGTESHTYNRNRWDSLEHKSNGVEGTHTYRIYCTGCSYSRIITLICNYERTGSHATPY